VAGDHGQRHAGKKPLADEAGVLKSACASTQTMPQRPRPRPATTPIAASQDPASTIGSRPVLIAERTTTRTPWLTASDAAATPAPTPGWRLDALMGGRDPLAGQQAVGTGPRVVTRGRCHRMGGSPSHERHVKQRDVRDCPSAAAGCTRRLAR
jgi:hypothetical protein